MKRKDYTYRYGYYMFLSVTAFFFLMKFLYLDHYASLRAFNFVFIIYFTNKLAETNLIENNKVNYLVNFRSLVVANTLNILLCTLGLIIYLSYFNPAYTQLLGENLLFGNNLSLFEICIALCIEGMASGVIVSFIVMQYWKNEKRLLKRIDIDSYLKSK